MARILTYVERDSDYLDIRVDGLDQHTPRLLPHFATERLPLMPSCDRQRLDQALVSRGLVVSRARARDLIQRGEVSVEGVRVVRPAAPVRDTTRIDVRAGAGDYVSRGYLKLGAALTHFGFSAAGRTALDLGASTGGFTERLLEAGAAHVFAVDNGRGQLHARLSADPRVTSLEAFDARKLTSAEITGPVEALVADVSFISLVKALPAALRLAVPGCWLVALVKPQFEAEPAFVPRSGIVLDPAVHAATLSRVHTWLAAQPGWSVLGSIPSPIPGGDGNVEFLLGAHHAG